MTKWSRGRQVRRPAQPTAADIANWAPFLVPAKREDIMATNRSTAVQVITEPVSALEKAVVFGDVTALDERGRLEYLRELAAAHGLNPLTRPFGYIVDKDGTYTVYLTATGGAQMGLRHEVSITKIEDHGIVNGFYRFTVHGATNSGRTDIEIGSVVATWTKTGETMTGLHLENARKKALTQAKTRLRKSLTGMAGVLAEEEVDDVPHLRRVQIEEEEPRQLRSAQAARTPTRAEQNAKLAADLRAAAPPSPPATPEQRTKIALLERIYVAWWGPLRNVPEIVSERDAVAWIGQLNQLRKAPLPNPTEQVSEEQYTLCVEMASELVAAGVDVAKFPEDLTCAGSYELYKALAKQHADIAKRPQQAPPAEPGVIEQDQQDTEDLPF